MSESSKERSGAVDLTAVRSGAPALERSPEPRADKMRRDLVSNGEPSDVINKPVNMTAEPKFSGDELPSRVRFWIDPAELWAALIAFVVVGAVFISTVAPTVTFWDSGEFIACSHILGIPHPPGTPFFILLGRIASILGPFGEVAWRVNMLSALSSVGAAVFACLLTVRLVLPWMGDLDQSVRRVASGAAGVCAAFTLAFGSTFWANGTEAEVYGASILFMMVVTWLAIIWREAPEARGADRLLVLVLYLTFLGVGVHMQNLMMVGPIFLMVALRQPSRLRNPPLWLVVVVATMALYHTTGFLVFSVASFCLAFSLVVLPARIREPQSLLSLTVMLGLLGFALWTLRDTPGFESGYMWGGLIALFFFFLVQAGDAKQLKKKWLLPAMLLLVTLVGYSPHAYIPMRSLHEPAIDENDPQEWVSFKGFLERKQYGSESMLTRAATRRGSWQSQLIDDENMGLWSNFRRQFSGNSTAHMLFVFAGVAGLLFLLSRDLAAGSLLGTAAAIGSVGLVLYLNFSDGTMGPKAEVRNRDYFFTPGFAYFSVLVGIGVGALLDIIYRWARENRWAAGVPVAAMALPYLQDALPGILGMELSSVAVVLGSVLIFGVVAAVVSAIVSVIWAEPGARARMVAWSASVLMVFFAWHQPVSANYFTHDRHRDRIANDYGRNILASCDENALIFTNGDNDTFPLWYLQEVEGYRRDVRVVNLSLLNTDWYIKQLRDREPTVPIALTNAEIVAIPAAQLSRDNRVIRKQDLMIEHIVTENRWDRPVLFAITVPESNRLGLESNLQMEGFIYRLMPRKVEYKINAEVTWENLAEKYRYSGLDDARIYKDANTLNLLNNYIAIVYQLARHYRTQNDLERAAEALEFGLARVPSVRWEIEGTLAQIYEELGRSDDARRIADQIVLNYSNSTDALAYAGRIYESVGSGDRAERLYREALEVWPEADVLYQSLIRMLYKSRKSAEVREVLDAWITNVPGSRAAQELHRKWRESGTSLEAQ